MTKEELTSAVNNTKEETREALETILNALNQGQRKKLEANILVKKLLDRYIPPS